MSLDLTDDKSTLVQVTTPSHYLNQCWLPIRKVQWYSSEGIIIRRSEDSNPTKQEWKLHFQNWNQVSQVPVSSLREWVSERQWIKRWNMLLTQVHEVKQGSVILPGSHWSDVCAAIGPRGVLYCFFGCSIFFHYFNALFSWVSISLDCCNFSWLKKSILNERGK